MTRKMISAAHASVHCPRPVDQVADHERAEEAAQVADRVDRPHRHRQHLLGHEGSQGGPVDRVAVHEPQADAEGGDGHVRSGVRPEFEFREQHFPDLASDHKYLRICDLCKELAFGTQRGLGQSSNSYNSLVFIAL
jgi:hypothetical protein